MSRAKSIRMELIREKQRLISATESWFSICVVNGFQVSSRLSTNSCEILIQSRSGYATLWALRFPVAPLNLPRISIYASFFTCLESL